MSLATRPKLDSNLILEAIDALKARKARPDKTRICLHLERKGFQRNDILVVLSCAVRDGEVLKVKYKDYYSYRNPHKPSSGSNSSGSQSKNGNHKDFLDENDEVSEVNQEHPNCSTQSSSGGAVAAGSGNNSSASRPLLIRRIMQAISGEIRKSESKSGASVQQILNSLHSKKQFLKYNETLLEKVLRKEVQTGQSIRMVGNGRYTLVNKKEMAQSKDGEQLDDEDYVDSDISSDYEDESFARAVVNGGKRRLAKDSSEPVKCPEKRTDEQTLTRARPISQRKKIKKSLGPDFLDPSDLGYQYLRDTYEPKCAYCLQPGSNPRQEQLISCTKCGFKVHPSCCKTENELETYPNGDLLCISCKPTCGLCQRQSGSNESMISCLECEDSFHLQCVKKTTNSEVKVKAWLCNKCTELDDISLEDNFEATEQLSSRNSSPDSEIVNGIDSESCGSLTPEKQSSAEINPKVPKSVNGETNGNRLVGVNGNRNKYSSKDPGDWSVDDVVDFITNIGYPHQATIFKEQEIDGRSLLLLKRMDVLTGLSLKLGPALKIYAHIFQLQGSKMSLINPFISEITKQMKSSGKSGERASVSV